jgi:hypothetical protein
MDDADAPSPPLRGSAAPINRDEVERCRDLLREIAATLRGEEAPAQRGVALVARLLRDGASPVYARDVEGALGPALRQARTALLLLRPDQDGRITGGKRSSTQSALSGSRS